MQTKHKIKVKMLKVDLTNVIPAAKGVSEEGSLNPLLLNIIVYELGN